MRPVRGKFLILSACVVAVALRATAAEQEALACQAWPGEPDPLPTVYSSDPVRARWAVLRAAELMRAANSRMQTGYILRETLVRRAACLDPRIAMGSETVEEGTEAVKEEVAVGWLQPQFVVELPSQARLRLPATTVDLALQSLAEQVAVIWPEEPRRRPLWQAAEPAAALASAELSSRVDDLLHKAEELARAAHFEEALDYAERARQLLREGSQASSSLRERRVRIEVVSATAQLALGDEAAARQSFARALAVNPALELDPVSTPPKLRRALENIRREEVGQ